MLQFTKFSENKEAVDYIQYPRETLRFKTGDCDDMTSLYCSLLENIGISTRHSRLAFRDITAPID